MNEPGNYFEIADLIAKFSQGTLNETEAEQLKHWVEESKTNRELIERLTNPDYLEKNLKYWGKPDMETHWKQLKVTLSEKEIVGVKDGIVGYTEKPGHWYKILRKNMQYAAILIPVVIIFGMGWYFLKQNKSYSLTASTDALSGVQIMPKGNVARLILGNGKMIQLHDSMQEAITEEDGTKLHNHSSRLSYTSGHRSGAHNIYNTLLTPKGGEYQVQLSDGTKVWLNAASSLRYPTAFNGKERKVFLKGEAYFEVAKDKNHPFIVDAGKMHVRVLGTKFNVHSYQEDPKQSITLAEGAVQVNETGGQKSILLKPGYKAVMKAKDKAIYVSKANIAAALAWKNDLFLFDNESLGNIMRTLSRWYDVHVVYEDGVNSRFHFTGRIKKYNNITGILRMIEMMKKVRFIVNGKELKVEPWNSG